VENILIWSLDAGLRRGDSASMSAVLSAGGKLGISPQPKTVGITDRNCSCGFRGDLILRVIFGTAELAGQNATTPHVRRPLLTSVTAVVLAAAAVVTTNSVVGFNPDAAGKGPLFWLVIFSVYSLPLCASSETREHQQISGLI